MSKLALSIAVGDYDRVRPLVDGSVQIDGVDPVFMLLEPEEIFFRAFRHADFDICELSMSSFTVKTANGDCPYVGVPVFPSRAFRHNSIYIRTDRGIAKPEDLKGRRIGVPEYQVTANVWTRAFLEDEHSVRPSDVTWVRHDLRHAGGRRDRCGDRPACAVLLHQRPQTCCLALSRSGSGGRRVVPQNRNFSHYAYPRRPPHAGGTASLAADRGDEGV